MLIPQLKVTLVDQVPDVPLGRMAQGEQTRGCRRFGRRGRKESGSKRKRKVGWSGIGLREFRRRGWLWLAAPSHWKSNADTKLSFL